MNEKQKREPKEPLRIPLDFEETLEGMLKVKPPPERKPEAGKKDDRPRNKETNR